MRTLIASSIVLLTTVLGVAAEESDRPSPVEVLAPVQEAQEQGKHGDALKLLSTHAGSLSGTAEYWSLLGDIQRSLANSDLAVDAYKRALMINPASYVDYCGLGFSYALNGEFQKSVSAYETAITLEPDRLSGYFRTALVYKYAGRFREAVTTCLAGIDHAPQEPDLEAQQSISSIRLVLAQSIDEMKSQAGVNNTKVELPSRNQAPSGRIARRSPTTPSPIQQVAKYQDLDGRALIIAPDGTFLGLISSDRFHKNSIMNDLGEHGSNLSDKSIFNRLSNYGGDIGQHTPWSKIVADPPKVFLDETFVGYLTVSRFHTPRIDPHGLVAYLKSKIK